LLKQLLRYHFIEKKLNTVVGYFFLCLIAVSFVYFISRVSTISSPLLLAVAAIFLLCIYILKNPYFGLYFLIVFSSVTITIDRITQLPLPSGNLVEFLGYFIFFSILLKFHLKKNVGLKFWGNPITIMLFILFAYYLVEIFNPEMFSKLGWLSFFRKQFSYFVFYFICYALLDSKKRIIYFVRFMIILSTVLSLYACKQQWFGYAKFELAWVGTGNGYTLLFQGGMLRKFSVFSDPATSGILFASIVMLCTILFFRIRNEKEKFWLGLAWFINLLGYSYSGTRTATLMIVSGIIFYFITTISERRAWIFMFCSLIVFTGLMLMPRQNAIANRIRSTFQGTKDPSAAIRDYDRHEVQPYIQDHPMGGGIFTSGEEGNKYNQGHYLEFFQADSGYLKILAEQGSIGLSLVLIFYFTIMRIGLYHFFRAADPQIRTYYIGLLVMMFTLLVAQYSQMAISQYPIALYFYAILVIFIKLAEFDKHIQSK
jgi:putative inorganic carbon (HCO3(-)) transporter